MTIENRVCAFDWCQNQRHWTTLKDHHACVSKHVSFGAHEGHDEYLNEDRPILSATKM